MEVSRATVYRRRCCVPLCTHDFRYNPDLKFFCFPRDPMRREHWLINIDNPSLRYLSSTTLCFQYRICSTHFRDADFQTPQKKRLNFNAVPSIFPRGDPADAGILEVPVPPTTTSGQNAGREFSMDTISTPFRQPSLTPRRRRKNVNVALKRSLHLSGMSGVRRLLKMFSTVRQYREEVAPFLHALTPAARGFIVSQLKFLSRTVRKPAWSTEKKALTLSIYKTSPKCYRLLEKLFRLPSIRTLRRTLQEISFQPGLRNEQFLQHLCMLSERMNEKHRHCVLLFDEVALHAHVTVGKNGKSIIGLENYGDYSTPYIADHALVFMLRGINKNWKQPVSYYFVRSTTQAVVLKKLVKEVIRTLHQRTRFIVMASVSDQGATNQSAMLQLSRESGNGDDFIYNVDDVKNGETVSYTVYHLFDPPHLLKCIRNHFMQKDVHFDGKVAKWGDLQTLYDLDGNNPDSKMCLKLTEKHIHPIGRQKMKVSLATQVFSRSVYAALEFSKRAGGWSCNEGTSEFILFMDQLFDSLNSVRSSAKPLQRPLTDSSAHAHFWENAKLRLSKLVFKKGKEVVKPPLSIKNVVATIRNIQSLWSTLKGLGYKFLLTRCLNQDPLENFFGIIRGLCGQNYRPTCLQFSAAFKTCLVNNMKSTSSLTNCEDDGTDFLVTLLSPASEAHESVTLPVVPQTSNSTSS